MSLFLHWLCQVLTTAGHLSLCSTKAINLTWVSKIFQTTFSFPFSFIEETCGVILIFLSLLAGKGSELAEFLWSGPFRCVRWSAGTGTAAFPGVLHTFGYCWPSCLMSNQLLWGITFGPDIRRPSFQYELKVLPWYFTCCLCLSEVEDAGERRSHPLCLSCADNNTNICCYLVPSIFGEITVVVQSWKRWAADHIGIACNLGLSAFLSLHVVLEPVKSIQYKCLHMELWAWSFFDNS